LQARNNRRRTPEAHRRRVTSNHAADSCANPSTDHHTIQGNYDHHKWEYLVEAFIAAKHATSFAPETVATDIFGLAGRGKRHLMPGTRCRAKTEGAEVQLPRHRSAFYCPVHGRVENPNWPLLKAPAGNPRG
jgi:hypothetical protein